MSSPRCLIRLVSYLLSDKLKLFNPIDDEIIGGFHVNTLFYFLFFIFHLYSSVVCLTYLLAKFFEWDQKCQKFLTSIFCNRGIMGWEEEWEPE